MATPPLDHYRLLGLARGASADEIASAYRARAQVCHPDRLSGSPEAVVRAASDLMGLLNEARRVLSDPQPDHEPDPSPAREPTYVPLTLSPDRIQASDVVPGTPVTAVVRFESPVPQSAAPRVRGSDPGMVIETDILHGSSRRAQVRIRIHTNLLAEHRSYEMELAAEWGTALGIITFAVATSELREWDDDDRARLRHPSARSRRAPGRHRRRDLGRWLVGGFVLPVLAAAWARGHLPVPAPPGPRWVQLAAAVVFVCGLYPMVVTRGFSDLVVLRRGFSEAGTAVLRLGAAVIWTARAAGRLLTRLFRWGHTRPDRWGPTARDRIRLGRR